MFGWNEIVYGEIQGEIHTLEEENERLSEEVEGKGGSATKRGTRG